MVGPFLRGIEEAGAEPLPAGLGAPGAQAGSPTGQRFLQILQR